MNDCLVRRFEPNTDLFVRCYKSRLDEFRDMELDRLR
jgi:hypothetical protein